MARYDDVNMDSDVSSISMTVNNGLLKQHLSIQQLPPQSRFNSHRSPRPPQNASGFLCGAPEAHEVLSKTPRIEILLHPKTVLRGVSDQG